MKRKVRLGAILGVIGFIVIAAVVCTTSGSETTDSGDSAVRATISVTASDLIQAYESNEVRANAKYEGKWVRVTGVVASISEDLFGDESLALEDAFGGVDCDYNDETQGSKAQQLDKGDSVTVVGQVDDYFLSVRLNHCEIVP